MDIPQIHSKLEELFQEHRIVFWNDKEGEFEDSLNNLGLEGVEVIRPDKEGQFKTKITLEIERPDQKFLIFSAEAVPDHEDDWLLDIRLYSYEFSADRASVIIDELGLKNHQLREFLNQRKKFFASKARLSALKSRVNPEDSRSELDRKMLAVVVKSEHDDFFNIIRSIYDSMGDAENLDDYPDVWEQIQKLELEEPFWSFIKTTFGYEDENHNLRNLLTCLFVTDLGYALGEALPNSFKHFVLPYSNQSNVAVCLAQWRDSSSKGWSYDNLTRLTADALAVEGQVENIKFETLLNAETFLDVEKVLARKLRDRVIQTTETINADEINLLAQGRQNKHWANSRLEDRPEVPRRALNAVYEAIIRAAEFFELRNAHSGGFDYKSAKEVYDAYCSELYRFDQLYRLFCEYSDIAESQGWKLLKKLRDEIESAYRNSYLESLAQKWEGLIDLDKWKIDGVENQFKFYNRYVASVAGKRESRGKVTGYVIISDAFRYEAAEELTRQLNSKYRFTAETKSMLGVLPSYTALGMAALLPHKTIKFGDKDDICIDGKACASLEQRSNILAEHKGIAIRAQDLLAMSKEDGRDFVRDKGIVYIYHNTIDATGDTASSEGQTVRAVRQAIDELANLVKYAVNNLNASRIFVTSDHGFLYTNSKPDETDKNRLASKPEAAVKIHKRFVLGRNLPAIEDSHVGKLSVTAGIDPNDDMGFAIPRGLSLFYFTGGARFIHGGISLQEVVIPVVIAGRVRGKAAEKTRQRKVSIQVLGTNIRITTNRHRFQLLQTDAVSERVKPMTVKVAVYDDNDKPVTSIESVTFDSSSNNMAERTKWVTLTLQNIAYKRDKDYGLILRDAETDIQIQSVNVRIDRAFGEDF
ncbi:BREX-1 system phosphatase PglZ type A [Planctomycetota bacterium]